MPTYDYECTECGYTFEYFQSMSDEPLKVCPKCKGKVRRLIGGGLGVIFKGSGFYVTDNKKVKSTPGSAGGSSGKKSEGEKKSTSEKKPESKAGKKEPVKTTA